MYNSLQTIWGFEGGGSETGMAGWRGYRRQRGCGGDDADGKGGTDGGRDGPALGWPGAGQLGQGHAETTSEFQQTVMTCVVLFMGQVGRASSYDAVGHTPRQKLRATQYAEW